MTSRRYKYIVATLLIAMLFSALFNVPAALAEGDAPTEPPVATEAQTEFTPEPTAAPEEPSATPEPAASAERVAPENTPIAGILADTPEDTKLVVLDEQGQPLALGTQETAEAVVESDPVWCPAGQLPGGVGCSIQYATITDLLTAMRTNPAAFAANGTIFLEHGGNTTFTTPLILDDSVGSLSGSFATLSTFNLTVRGGYNPGTNTVSGTQALFGNDGTNQGYILIGSPANPWVGNVKLEDIEVRGASLTNAITVYTSGGDIIFDDVDVADQTGDQYLAYLHSQTGDIVVENGSNFDGNDTGTGVNESKGFFAQTGGSITINSTSGSYTFRDNEGTDPDAHNGATFIAPTVTLNDVISRANDGNGIFIQGATTVTLNSIISANTTGTGNGLSGILINDSALTVVNVFGGLLANNGRYGIEFLNGTGTLVVHTEPTCTSNTLGCYNVTPVASPTQPTPTEPTPTQPTPTEPAPTQPTPTLPTATEPTPTQPTATEPSPTQPAPTEETPVAPAEPTSPVPTGSGSGTGGASSTSSLGSGSSTGSALPLTGGAPIDLDCDSVFTAFGVKLSFFELCDYQTVVNQVEEAELPGALAEGMSFVMGLDLSVLSDDQALESLPAGAGVQLDFPVGAGEYAVLFWDEAAGEWAEVSSALDADDLAGALGGDTGDGLYRLNSDLANVLQVLTTDKIGTFVLVQK